MKNLFQCIFTILIVAACNPPDSKDSVVIPVEPSQIIGAWETWLDSDSGVDLRTTAIVGDKYLTVTFYNDEARVFYATTVGNWSIDSVGQFVIEWEFVSNNTIVDKEPRRQRFELSENGDSLRFEDEKIYWTKVDDGTPGALSGAWLITGRKRGGEISRRTPGARKTMKILSGTRFQWIAYNSETGAFSGTGGGTYTTSDSAYTENIEFFSRDSMRVGDAIEFTFSLDSGEWHHSGFSSKGDSLYEIWTPRKWLEMQ